MVQMKQLDLISTIRTHWNSFGWIVGTIFIPITIPYIIFQVVGYYKEKKYRDCLPGKVVVITGASSGLGESLAHTFYVAGCKVILAARRKDELERVKKELMQIHSTVPTHPPVVLPIDLSDINEVPNSVAKILGIFGHIDILVNNSGISVRSDALHTSIDVDIKIMLVNYFGTVAMTKAVLPSMIKRKTGRIVCVSSVQGKFAIPHRSAYAASKHALQAFCDSLRAEVADDNIKVTLVSPGYINTALSINALTGSGKQYGLLDTATAQGTTPEKMSRDILRAVLRDEKDVIISSFAPRVAYWLRFLCPPLYFLIMEKRARKLSLTEE